MNRATSTKLGNAAVRVLPVAFMVTVTLAVLDMSNSSGSSLNFTTPLLFSELRP